MTLPHHPTRIWLVAFALAWAADLLFWQQSPGLSLPFWIALALVGLFLCAAWEGKRPSLASYPLALAAFGLSLTNFLRAEPFSRFFCGMLALGCLALLTATLLNGHWLFYRIGDTIMAGFKLLVAVIVRGAGGLSEKPADPQASPVPKGKSIWQKLRPAFPYLRGLILALPVLGVLGGLLASADPVFADRMRILLQFIDLSRLPEYLFRFFYIVVFAYIFCGVLLHALLPQSPETRPDPNQAWKSRFLGTTECFIILGGVVLMFAFFLILQFRYLFGGQANITETGYTYAEYARRGFFELVWVAVLSLGLYLGLGTITRREKPGTQRTFSLLSILLMSLVLLILASAFQRLLLYEGAYGFTRLRTYTHIFIPWLAVLLLAAILLETFRRPGHFGLALLLFTFGFGLTFAFLNVDNMITRQNLARAQTGSELDITTLTSLSADAVPALADAYRSPTESENVRSRAGAALACHWINLASQPYRPDWRGYNQAEANAAAILAGLDLKAYLHQDQGTWEVLLEQQPVSCRTGMD